MVSDIMLINLNITAYKNGLLLLTVENEVTLFYLYLMNVNIRYISICIK